MIYRMSLGRELRPGNQYVMRSRPRYEHVVERLPYSSIERLSRLDPVILISRWNFVRQTIQSMRTTHFLFSGSRDHFVWH